MIRRPGSVKHPGGHPDSCVFYISLIQTVHECKTWAGNLIAVGFHGRCCTSCLQPGWMYCSNSCLHSNWAVAFLIPNGAGRIKGWERLGSCEMSESDVIQLGLCMQVCLLKRSERGKESCACCLQVALMVQMMFKHTGSAKQRTMCETFWVLYVLQSITLASSLPASTGEHAFRAFIWELKLTECISTGSSSGPFSSWSLLCVKGVLLSTTTGKETKQRRIYCTAENYSTKMVEEWGFYVRQS